ncbi:zinc-dependent metalloprotease [Actinomycetaceae bacterium TAE3-ERU4]|nr:zinc-dependent metalloprotease [Actinomycetaceae bacterium TAE3-ERU4]
MAQDFDANDSFEQMLQMLAKMLGEEDTEALRRQLESQGLNSETMGKMSISGLSPEGGFGFFPGTGPMMFSKDLFSHASGPVNWQLALQVAKQSIAQASDPTLSAAQAAQYKSALQVATLWLDAVTNMLPPQADPEAWTRTQWLETTMETWKQICEPIAINATGAISTAMRSALNDAGLSEDNLGEGLKGTGLPPELLSLLGGKDSPTSLVDIMDQMSASVFGLQLGQAIGALAKDALGYTAIGLPMVGQSHLALVVQGVLDFGDGLDVPTDEVTAFVAVREAAHARLFAAVPWLRHHILTLLRNYAEGIEIDMGAIEQAARSVDPTDPESFQDALQGGMFSPQISPQQQQMLDQLTNALAIVEGWVEEVTLKATLPHLKNAVALDEMMRRRRAAGSPAEKLFAQLVGLQLAPKRSRDAAKLWSTLTDSWGPDRRDSLWAHPSQIPTSEELDNPTGIVDSREAKSVDSMDAELAKMLDGTLDWADGLSPEIESEGDRKATEE